MVAFSDETCYSIPGKGGNRMLQQIEQLAAGKQLYSRVIHPVCQQYGLTQAEMAVLLFLADNPDWDTAAQIVRYRHLTPSHVSLSVHTLEEKSLLVCEHRKTDHRIIHLSLTEQAGPIVQAGRAAQDRFIDLLTDGFSEEEKQQLQDMLARVFANCTKQLLQTERNGSSI